jgi:nucleotide-binding universal stress UspA family protein
MPGVCRIVAGVSGSPGSVHALRRAADLASHHDAILIPLHAWVPPEGDVHERTHPCPELRQLWDQDAWQRLHEALDTAFGGLPVGVRAQLVVRRGLPSKVLVGEARQAGDLLVIGAGHRGALRRLGSRGVARYCLINACCPVLVIPPPALARDAGHGLRGRAFRHRAIRAMT